MGSYCKGNYFEDNEETYNLYVLLILILIILYLNFFKNLTLNSKYKNSIINIKHNIKVDEN